MSAITSRRSPSCSPPCATSPRRFERAGHTVRYVTLDDDGQQRKASMAKSCAPWTALRSDRVAVTEPGEWRLREGFEALRLALPVPLDILPDTRFLCSHAEFNAWADGRRELRMEYFYREMRRRHDILMEPDGKPSGGRWNFDADNRKPPKAGLDFPRRLSFRKDAITLEVLDLVRRRFPEDYGRLEPFHFAVTRQQALRELDHFIAHILPGFGDYQDAMVAGEPYLRHSLLSAYINAGLLYPLEVCRRAEAAYRDGSAPLNAVEGFIRQILGWREYVRGIYWRFMPGYVERNALDATRAAALVLLERRNAHGLHAGSLRAYARPCLFAPYPAPDDHRQFRAAGRDRPARPCMNGISPSMPMPMNGSKRPTRSAWRCTPMADCWRRSPMRPAATTSTG